MKMLGIVAVGVVRESRQFSRPHNVGRIARSSVIAQLSCFFIDRIRISCATRQVRLVMELGLCRVTQHEYSTPNMN